MKKNDENGLALRSRPTKGEGGFTLIEIMVVVVILGVIATVVVANIGQKPGRAKATLTETQIKILKGDVELYRVDHNRFPDSLNDLVPKYRDEVPKDGWGRAFQYRVPESRGAFDIVSLGEDGLPGGEGVDADLWSHPLTK
jgi:general secretion pathway protein G